MPNEVSYHPKQDHPWRQYRNKKTSSDEPDKQFPQITLLNFLKNIVENWDSYKIPPNNFEDREYISLCKLDPDKQADWLIGFLKKHWLNSNRGALIYE